MVNFLILDVKEPRILYLILNSVILHITFIQLLSDFILASSMSFNICSSILHSHMQMHKQMYVNFHYM